MTPAQIEAELGQRRASDAAREEVIEIWPEHHATWDAWQALGNQWNVVTGLNGGGYLGLIFASIPTALEAAGVKKKQRRTVIRNLRYMEGEALAVLNEMSDHE